MQSLLERDHHQLDSNLVAAHIKAILKAQFTLTTTAIQTSVMEKWGYEISYKKTLDGKHKEHRRLFGDFSQSYTELHVLGHRTSKSWMCCNLENI